MSYPSEAFLHVVSKASTMLSVPDLPVGKFPREEAELLLLDNRRCDQA